MATSEVMIEGALTLAPEQNLYEQLPFDTALKEALSAGGISAEYLKIAISKLVLMGDSQDIIDEYEFKELLKNFLAAKRALSAEELSCFKHRLFRQQSKIFRLTNQDKEALGPAIESVQRGLLPYPLWGTYLYRRFEGKAYSLSGEPCKSYRGSPPQIGELSYIGWISKGLSPRRDVITGKVEVLSPPDSDPLRIKIIREDITVEALL